MDELEFNADAIQASADANLEIEGYEDEVEAIQQAYPEEDWRTPAEQAAEKEAEVSESATTENVESAQPVEPVTPEVTETKGSKWKGRYEVDPTTGLLDINQIILENNIDPEYAKGLRLDVNVSAEEIDAYHKWNKAGGQKNSAATLELLNTIESNPQMLAAADRNKDGKVTFSDFYDVTRFKQIGLEITPERDAWLTEQWLNRLNRTAGKQGGFPDLTPITGAAGLGFQLYKHLLMHPMANYNHQRRLGILTDLDNNPFTIEMGGEQMRQSLSGGITQGVGDFILSAPEKAYAGFKAGLTDDDDETWFSWDAALKKDAVLDDIIYNHKDPLSFGYGTVNPVKRTWSDPTLFEVGRYAPAIALSAKLLPASATTITTGGAGFFTLKGFGTFALTSAKTIGVTYATEVLPTNVFADLETNAMKNMRDDKTLSQVINAHPETIAGGLQTANGQDNSVTRQLEFMRQEMGWEAGGLMFSHFAFRGVGKLFNQIPEQLSKKHWQKTQISVNAKQKIKETTENIFKKRKQVLDDIADAADDQTKIAQEGPSSKWQDPWDTNAGLDSTYGDFKNIKTVAGQQSAGVRGDISEVVDQVDEIRGQVGIEGGITDDLFTPIEKAEFSRSGIPDPWNKEAADAYWKNVDVQGRLKELNPLERNLKNLSKSSLESIQEILGRDFSSLKPEEFWPKEFLEMKFKPGEKLSDTKKWVIENLQVKDAVVNSLLKRLRAYADATGETLGKGDIFAKGGPMSNIAKNLTMGLTEIKKTQFKWDLATKKMLENNGELTVKQIREIDKLVDGEQLRLGEETKDGVRLLMQVLEGSDSDELAEGILDVFKVSNDIHNWKDFDAWMRTKIRGGEFAGKINTGVLLGELHGVMVNSILSGPKTPLRALLGTTTNSFLNAINEAAGATFRAPFTGDIASKTASIAKLKGMFELIPESFTVFRKNFKSKWNADIADIRTRYSEGPTRGDQNWNLFAKWTERNGTAADKAAFYMANIARQANNNKLFTWSPRAMSAIDDTFKWLLARTRAKEKGFREALETAGGDYTKLTSDVLKQAEDNYYKTLLNKEGDIDLGADKWLKKQFEEVTLTSELKGWSGELDKLFKKAPLIKPFYLFARTGINGLNFTYKNTPLLGALHKESIDILRHTGDDFTPLMKYGIENANDLSNARNLFAGRQAVGAATVTTFAGMYMAGQLTGNGPADRKLRQSWINAGWKPNHFYIGDVGFDYTTLEPYNIIFSTIADIGDNMELMGSEWAEKRLQAAAFVIGRGLQGKTYMSGLDQLMQIAQMKPGALDKAGANILNNSIPLAGMRNEFGKWINPHMKELNSDMWSSIRNRNLASEALALDPIPNKSDLLNGKPINNWNIIGRSFNAISPVQLDIRNDTPGRKLLLDSNYDLKSTTYAYGGYSFTKDAHVRAHFQNAIGTVPITIGFKKFKNVEEALNYLALRPDVQKSMREMKANVNNPAAYDINPNTYPHNTLIDNVMNQARSKAWAKLRQPDHPGYARVQKLMSEKDGHTSRTRDNRNEILDLGNPRQVDNFPKN